MYLDKVPKDVKVEIVGSDIFIDGVSIPCVEDFQFVRQRGMRNVLQITMVLDDDDLSFQSKGIVKNRDLES